MRILLIILVVINCKEKISESNLVLPPLNQETLLGKWTPEFEDHGTSLEFQKDGKFLESFNGEGCPGFEGKFQIKETSLELMPNEKTECDSSAEERKKNSNCKLVKDDKSFYARVKLVCGTENFFSANYLRKEGEELQIGNTESILVNSKDYKTTDSIFFRIEPSKTSKSMKCKLESFGPEPIVSDTLPRDTLLYVVARTKEKVKVDNKENFWYYVKPELGWYSPGCEQKLGWVFGEFISK
jgi:hypothetical protein